jgi:hypothetical protein
MSEVTVLTIYIVDYDLSLSHPSQRRGFYRAVHRLLKTVTPETSPWSTQSVIVVADRDTAQQIYDLARVLGSAHLYRAVRLK